MKKLVVIGLQQTFLQMVHDQVRELVREKIQIRTVSLNELDENPLLKDETVLYFSRGLKRMVEKMFPGCKHYIYARRENLIYNMGDLFALGPDQKILVVNDVKSNTDEMIEELQGLQLGHTFFPYYPDEPLEKEIDWVVTAGERALIPIQLKDKPIIDIGLRFISLETVYTLFDHFNLPHTHAALARHYMRSMMMLSEKWPVLGEKRYQHASWFGVRKNTSAQFTFDSLIKNSPAMKTLCTEAAKMAVTDKPIHLYGRLGTGKSIISQAIHNASPFAKGPFVSINCDARRSKTLERELFGWEDGNTAYKSLFETAKNGTLCIEEIDKLPEKLQAGLLQAVTEKKIIRADGNGVVDIQIRLITTASQRLDRDLPETFNPKLLFMLTQHICRVPSLHQRMEDFEALMTDYLENRLQKKLTFPNDTVDALKAHTWDGNVRELYNVLQHIACMSKTELQKKYLPYYITRNAAPEKKAAKGQKEDFTAVTREIITHGFLDESCEILKIYQAGKIKNLAYGRSTIQKILEKKNFKLSKQKLRLKLERMNKLGLLIVRPGRGGTTISEKGERYLQTLLTKDLQLMQ